MKNRTKVAIGGGSLVVCLLLYGLIYPSVREFPERLKLQASRNHLEQLVAAEEAYFEKHGHYVSASPYPEERPGSQPLEWDLSNYPDHGFAKLGFVPDGDIYCRFGVAADGDAFTVEMECDPSDTGRPAYMGFVKPAEGERGGLQGPFGKCSSSGVFASNRPETGVVGMPGPCDEYSGKVMVVGVRAGKNSE